MLNPNYRYVSFDFETTGLDTTKDDPLQIGIVEFDNECNVIQTYQSLIKPTKPLTELKEIVRYVTGFKLEDLTDAPSYTSLLPQISQFFDDKTVIVGQNIAFDLAFLRRLLPDFVPVAQIDTYDWSKMMRHFQSSYALDVTAQTLLSKGLIDTDIISSTDQAHDALHDSLTTLAVRKATLQRLHVIRKKYLLVDYCIQRNDGIYNQLIKRTPKDYKFETKELFFPVLKKNLPPERSLVEETPTLKIEEFTSQIVDASSGSLSQFLAHIARDAKPWIISTNSRSKSNIIRKWFDARYIPCSTLQSSAIFDPVRIDKLLHKESLSDAEIGYIIKYYSHYNLGHARIDTNTRDEYMIHAALTSRKPQSSGEVIVTTHDQLLGADHSALSPHSHLLYMDNDRRIQSLKRKVSQPFDMNTILSLVEGFAYELDLLGLSDQHESLQSYIQQLTVFLGVLGNGLNTLFKGHAESRRACDFLIDEVRIQGIRALRDRLQQSTQTLESPLTTAQYTKLQSHIQRLDELLTGTCEVEKKMYHGDKRYYVLKSREPYLDREELISLLPPVTTTFISLKSGENSQSLQFPGATKRPQILQIRQLRPLDEFITNHQGNLFVFSGAKHISQSVFKHRVGNTLQNTRTIVGENITGGTGKNIYLANQGTQSGKPLIALGGYHFFMALIEKKFAFPAICMYYSKGTMTPQIITDLVWRSR